MNLKRPFRGFSAEPQTEYERDIEQMLAEDAARLKYRDQSEQRILELTIDGGCHEQADPRTQSGGAQRQSRA